MQNGLRAEEYIKKLMDEGVTQHYAVASGNHLEELLNLRETAMLLGFKDTRTVKKMYPFVNGYISLATLARCMTPGSKTEGSDAP